MLATDLKLITIYLFESRITETRKQYLLVKSNAADYAETRAQFIKDEMLTDMLRIASSLVGILIIFATIIFSGVLGLMWFFASIWSNPNKEIILGVLMLIPLVLGCLLFISIRNSWKKAPFMNSSTVLISNDWKSFRYSLDGTADTSDEANG
ncbi:phage holin family protein [Methylotenera sp.]|uniref:phage holin family protein n=1 Tax=Methylotenera sp. TaxID=2051956 RepID=UPI002486ED67|nr:phage holin family protein [Methylotenera sp.]MDI1299950.1 phage holin family protein [Methylotenera sp.]